MEKIFIIDFDSTFVQCEALEELARISLAGNPNKTAVINQIQKITKAGMAGEIPFEKSLSKRLALIKAKRHHVRKTAKLIKNKITPSFWQNKDFIKKNKERIYIISGAFREFIIPTVSLFDIPPNHVLANDFVYGKNGEVISCDQINPLTKRGGKVQAIASLHLRGEIWVIGDGYTDYEIKKLGAADYFIAFTENIRRKVVVEKADWEVKNFNQLLNKFKL